MSHLTACSFVHVIAGTQLSTEVEQRCSMKATRGSRIAGVRGPGANSAEAGRPDQAHGMPLVSVPHSTDKGE